MRHEISMTYEELRIEFEDYRKDFETIARSLFFSVETNEFGFYENNMVHGMWAGYCICIKQKREKWILE